MTNKFIHLTFKDRQVIEQELNNKSSVAEIASLINKNNSTIYREIKNRKVKYEPAGWNNYKVPCANKDSCYNKFCDFNKPCYVKSSCIRLSKSPYVCNGCKSRSGCRKERYTYFAKDAHDNYIIKSSECRKGIDITSEEIEQINKIITPRIM